MIIIADDAANMQWGELILSFIVLVYWTRACTFFCFDTLTSHLFSQSQLGWMLLVNIMLHNYQNCNLWLAAGVESSARYYNLAIDLHCNVRASTCITCCIIATYNFILSILHVYLLLQIPAVCRPLEHQWYSRGHHTQFPRLRCCRSPHVQWW